MIDLGFANSATVRLGMAALFTAAAFFAVLSIEQQSTPTIDTQTTPTPAIVATADKKLILETTYPVERWHVQMHGQDITATSSTAQRYEAMIQGDPAQCFVQAESADVLSTAAAALRWHYNGQSGIIWGEGSVAGALGNGSP